MQEFEAFEKRYVFEVLKNPDYRLGQAFINDYRDISNSMIGDKDGIFENNRLWLSRDREEVLKIIERYVEQ
jgi:hypothetical protein